MRSGVYVEPNGNLMELDRWGTLYFLYDNERPKYVKFLHTREQFYELRDYLNMCIYKGEL